jgi:enoyl-CoA hydratase/carnithine racemase
MDYQDLIVETADHVCTITLNRPDRLNAISRPMLEGLARALTDADRDPDVRVIVLTGAGRGFCSGLDLKDVAAGTGIGAGGGTPRFDLQDGRRWCCTARTNRCCVP